MFTIAEIAKTFITDNFTPLTSWVYSKQITLTQAEIDASYWVAWGGTIDYNQENRAISSVYLDYILSLVEKDSLIDCQAQEESFYFDSANQILYIHVTQPRTHLRRQSKQAAIRLLLRQGAVLRKPRIQAYPLIHPDHLTECRPTPI